MVLPKVFFVKSDPLTGTLLSFLTYALGFAARPLGGVFFGNLGDRIGRTLLDTPASSGTPAASMLTSAPPASHP